MGPCAVLQKTDGAQKGTPLHFGLQTAWKVRKDGLEINSVGLRSAKFLHAPYCRLAAAKSHYAGIWLKQGVRLYLSRKAQALDISKINSEPSEKAFGQQPAIQLTPGPLSYRLAERILDLPTLLWI